MRLVSHLCLQMTSVFLTKVAGDFLFFIKILDRVIVFLIKERSNLKSLNFQGKYRLSHMLSSTNL